jgi:hypothetical protein
LLHRYAACLVGKADNIRKVTHCGVTGSKSWHDVNLTRLGSGYAARPLFVKGTGSEPIAFGLDVLAQWVSWLGKPRFVLRRGRRSICSSSIRAYEIEIPVYRRRRDPRLL